MRPTPSLLLLLLPFLCAACGGEDAPGMGETGLDGPDRALDWSAEAVYHVGGFEAPDWATFGQVSRVAFDDAGNLFILDGQTDRVTVVSPQGEFLRTIGRTGEGPGELQTVFGMTVMPDGRVAISDFGHQGLVVFDAQGEWRGNTRLELGREGLPGRDMQPLGNDRILSAEALQITMSDGETEVGTMPDTDTRPIWSYPVEEGEAELAYGAWDPPPPPEGGEASLSGGEDGGNRMEIVMARTRAFTPGLHVAALPDGRLAVVDSLAWVLKLVDVATGAVERLSRPIPPTEVTSAIEELERERRLDEIGGSSGRLRVLGGGGDVAFDANAVRNMMRQQLETMVFFPQIPVVERIAVDGMGRIWVQRASGTPGEDGPTDVVTPGGDYLGTLPPDGLRIPDAFGPGGLAAVIDLDEYDVATVRVIRVPTEG